MAKVSSAKINVKANLEVEGSSYVEGLVSQVRLTKIDKDIGEANEISTMNSVRNSSLGKRNAASSKLNSMLVDYKTDLRKIKPKALGDILTSTVIKKNFNITSFMRAKTQDQWRLLKSQPDADLKRRLEILSTALSHIRAYPRVHEELLKFIGKPNLLLGWVKPLLNGRVRWGRDFYKESNFKFTKAELFDSICNTYTSWKPDDGRDLLIFLILELASIDLAPSGWMRDNFSYDLPLRFQAAANLETIQEVMEYNILQELIISYCELSEHLIPKIGSDKAIFYKGTIMLETDLPDFLAIRRRSLSSLLFDIKRTEQDVRYTLALIQGYIFDIKIANLDIIEEAMNSPEIVMLSERAEFFLEAATDLSLLDTLANISIPTNEIKKKVTRVIKYGLESPFFEQVTPKQFLDEVTVSTSYTLDGQLASVLALKHVKVDDQSYKVLRKEKSTISPYLYQYEELSFTGLETLLNTSQLGLEQFKDGQHLLDKVDLLFGSKVKLEGLITNLSDRELFVLFVALNNNTAVLNLPDTVFTYSGLGTANLSTVPKLVYPIELKPEDRVSFLPLNSLNHDYFFNNPVPWFLGFFSKREKRELLGIRTDAVTKRGQGRLVPLGKIDNFLLSRDYGGALEEINRGAAAQTLNMELEYDSKKFDISIRFSEVLSEQWLGSADVYYDALYIQGMSINAKIALALEELYLDSVASELGVAKTHDPLHYELDSVYIAFLRKFTSSSLLFKRMFDFALKSSLQQITAESGSTAKVHASTIYKEVSNAVGVSIFVALNDWLEFCPEIIEERILKAIDRSVNFKFESFFI